MTAQSAAIDLLHSQIADADTQWSLGTFGGIAEFSRDRDEKVSLTRSETGAAAVTARGGIAIELSDNCRPFAFECITRSSWGQRVALCLPAGACAMNRRTVLTELDVDREALQPQHHGSTLFDLALARCRPTCACVSTTKTWSRNCAATPDVRCSILQIPRCACCWK
jgi:hypothetical protein